ncbi:NAD(P)H-dependent D-xylose reductase [Plectosphaerella cucumerina]|uniref:NAD(P)H-dependent D-xylose reductase n=1 Tax=Plectosphaerella cucumerina TaxID=40658 RepID=A0A8K0TP88_9PEZI|nr:NAD(P)H-dependent D-xylose reductase [Plectosphaerella cucumerina]
MYGPFIFLAITHESSHQQLMPQVGFGLWKVPPEQTADTVYHAIKTGYRAIDGAYGYTNSAEAGRGVRRAIDEGLVRREDLFITSKLWNNYHQRQHAIEMARVESEAWGLGHLDLFLIHFPIAQRHVPLAENPFPSWFADKTRTRPMPLAKVPISETWQALETLVSGPSNPQGFVNSIGVSNFHTQTLYDLLSYAKVQPSVLQVEHHPYLVQPQLIAMAQENGIAVTAYSTFGPQSFLELDNKRAMGVVPLLEVPVVKKLAEKHGRTPGQILLRWCTQRGIVVIPKSTKVERMVQNLDCCSFDLTQEDLDEISALDRGLRFNDPGYSHGAPYRIFT